MGLFHLTFKNPMKKFFLLILAIIAGFIFFGGSSKSGAKLEEPTAQKAQEEVKTPPPPPVTRLESNISRALARMMVRDHFRAGKGLIDMPDVPIVDSYKVEFAFEQDPLTAKEKFLGKRVVVNSIVANRDISNDGVYYLRALNPRGLDTILAFGYGKKAKEDVMKIKRGDHVRLSCTCRGKDNGFLVFVDCSTEAMLSRAYAKGQDSAEKAFQSDLETLRKTAHFIDPWLKDAVKYITVMPDAGRAACEKGVPSCQTWLGKNLASLKKKLKDKPDAGAERLKELNF